MTTCRMDRGRKESRVNATTKVERILVGIDGSGKVFRNVEMAAFMAHTTGAWATLMAK